MITASPTCMVSELAIFATRAAAGTRSTCRSERSAAGSEAITFAATDSPPNSTVIASIVCTTWAAVMTLELGGESVAAKVIRSEEHTSELQSRPYIVCRVLLEKKVQRHAPL